MNVLKVNIAVTTVDNNYLNWKAERPQTTYHQPKKYKNFGRK